MTQPTTIAPCTDCGTLTETVVAKGAKLGGSGRCGPCQHLIDSPPRPPSTPLRIHAAGRLVPACRRCRHGRPIPGDPLSLCAACSSTDPVTPASPTTTATWPPCVSCGQPLFLLQPGRDTCERCRLDAVRVPIPSPRTSTTDVRTETAS